MLKENLKDLVEKVYIPCGINLAERILGIGKKVISSNDNQAKRYIT